MIREDVENLKNKKAVHDYNVYKNPEMLRELLDALNERFLCFVHIDKKKKIHV